MTTECNRVVRTTLLLTALFAGALVIAGELNAVQTLTRRDQFACYPAQFSTFAPRRITISDAVVPKLNIAVHGPVDVCPPARVDAVRAKDPSLYLTCHEITAPPVTRRSPGRISNSMGSARLTVEGARSSCISSSRTASAPPSLFLTCYGVVEPAGDTQRDSTIGDTFGTSSDRVDVGRPVVFCTQARHGSVPALHLMCYPLASKTVGRTVALTTGWGVLRGSPGLRDRICIQSSLLTR